MTAVEPYELHHGDVLDVLPTLEADSFDAMLTDPPYGLEFMGKDWDGTRGFESSLARAGTSKPGIGDRNTEWPSFYGGLNPRCRNCGRSQRGGSPCRCDKPDFPNERRNRAVLYQEWCEAWATETLRVLKPGAFALIFGGTRTFHRLAVALEDAGFEMRDTLMWIYGSGFPKSHNLSGEWSGYGTALKPAWEPVLLVRKPSPLTFAQNALEHECGALNIDGSRVPGSGFAPKERVGAAKLMEARPWQERQEREGRPVITEGHDLGRWPANLIHDGSDEVAAAFPLAPGQQGAVGPQHGPKPSVNAYGDYGPRQDFAPRLDTGSAARFFYAAKASAEERDEGLHQFATQAAGVKNASGRGYSERDPYAEVRRRNTHPTVKPIALTEYLARLLLPPERDTDRRILVPFAGSGSEMIGALRAGWDEAVGIEREPEYVEIARARLAHFSRGLQPRLLEAI